MKTEELRSRVRQLLRRNRKVAVAHIIIALALVGYVVAKVRSFLFDETFIMSAAFGLIAGFTLGIFIWAICTSLMILLRKGLIFRALEAFASETDGEENNRK